MPQKIVVAVGVAAQPISAVGITWTVMNWPLGFRELGWDVWVVEAIGGDRCIDANWQPSPFATSANKAHWEAMMGHFGFEGRATLLVDDSAPGIDDLRDFASEADLFLNLSGHFRSNAISFPRALKIYHDGDPSFTQIWAEAYGCDMNFAGHDRYFTAGTCFNDPKAFAPTCGLEWIPTFPPVTLKYWPFHRQDSFGRFTTIAHWEGYKNVEWNGTEFCGKREEFQRMIDVPLQVPAPIEVATAFSAHAYELGPFLDMGWKFSESADFCSSVEEYSRYIRESSAEFSVAKGGYVTSKTGWFSDRSVCYAAMGRPLILQDTGAAKLLPEGAGYFPFTTPGEASAACRRVIEDFPAQQVAARRLAEEVFSSDKVLTEMLNRL